MELKRVVVTGLGALTPVGNTVEETWENLKNGVSGASIARSLRLILLAKLRTSMQPTTWTASSHAKWISTHSMLSLLQDKLSKIVGWIWMLWIRMKLA